MPAILQTLRFNLIAILDAIPAIILVALLAASTAMCGCSSNPLAGPSCDGEGCEDIRPAVFDAGVIFTDRDRLVCFPAEFFDISDLSRIQSVKTSCDCVSASVVEYLDSRGNRSPAIALNFHEHYDGSTRAHPLLLETEILLDDGETIRCSAHAILASSVRDPHVRSLIDPGVLSAFPSQHDDDAQTSEDQPSVPLQSRIAPQVRRQDGSREQAQGQDSELSVLERSEVTR